MNVCVTFLFYLFNELSLFYLFIILSKYLCTDWIVFCQFRCSCDNQGNSLLRPHCSLKPVLIHDSTQNTFRQQPHNKFKHSNKLLVDFDAGFQEKSPALIPGRCMPTFCCVSFTSCPDAQGLLLTHRVNVNSCSGIKTAWLCLENEWWRFLIRKDKLETCQKACWVLILWTALMICQLTAGDWSCDCWWKSQNEFWGVQGQTLCSDSDKTAKHTGHWPKTSKPGSSQDKELSYSSVTKSVTWFPAKRASFQLLMTKLKAERSQGRKSMCSRLHWLHVKDKHSKETRNTKKKPTKRLHWGFCVSSFKITAFVCWIKATI